MKIGFIYDTIKNSYLLEAIQDELRRTKGNSKILSNTSIVTDVELVRFIADAARHDLVLTQHLRRAIWTKAIKVSVQQSMLPIA